MNNDILIQIDWPWALGIIGAIILIAWRGGSRFTRIETDIEWLKEKVNDIKASVDNKNINAFGSASPVALTPKGSDLLEGSGLKNYIDSNREKLIGVCKDFNETNAYEIQRHIFNYFDELKFDGEVDKKIKDYAYNQGVSTDIIRRVGAIYFRDICLKEFGMKKEDIDSHNN